MPTPEDVQFLANLTHHADLNINLGSTMTLDFGLHDKPVVNVAFDVADPPIFGHPGVGLLLPVRALPAGGRAGRGAVRAVPGANWRST